MLHRALPVVCLLALVTVSEAQAQGRRGGGGPGGYSRSSSIMLLGQESVQKELQLTPKQVQAITSITEQQRAAMSQAFQLDRDERGDRMQEISKHTESMIGQVITPQQQQRLMQISLQQQGTRAFERPEVVQSLGLTAEQQAQIQQIRDATSEEISELFRKQMEEIRKASEKKVAAVFTPEQAAQWNQVRGETFEGEIVSTRYGGQRNSSPGEQALRDSSSQSGDRSKSATNDQSSSRSRSATTQRSAAMNSAAKKPLPAKTPAKATPKRTSSAKKTPAQPATQTPPTP